jgi:Family of unknown function (DUF6529)
MPAPEPDATTRPPANPFDPPTEPILVPLTGPDTADPETTRPETARPGAARPGTARPGTAGPDPAAPTPATAADNRTRSGPIGLLLVFGLGSLTAVGLGAYGRLHEPTFFAINVAGFSSGTAAKAWLATVAFVLALVQLGSALLLYGRLPRIPAPRWTGALHRWSGRVAVLVTVPVAVHCLYALGFQTGSARVLVHSLVGCFFYGAFVSKMLILNRRDAPAWALPVLGGAVFTGLVALWSTSAAWFFGTSTPIF